GVLEGRDRLGFAGPGIPGDDVELDVLGCHHLRVHGAHRPALCNWRWISLASLLGIPGTPASSSRLALTIRSGDPKCWSSARLRTGPTPRSSSSSEWVIAVSRRLRWKSSAKRCAS